ncbi:MAG: hypothetical protein IPP77_03970 [Bacteroidetes bacterium]|nr:hypothetical protein [Bacteroidota bacterium]
MINAFAKIYFPKAGKDIILWVCHCAGMQAAFSVLGSREIHAGIDTFITRNRLSAKGLLGGFQSEPLVMVEVAL